MIIYLATNQINGKQYVGQTINNLNKRKSRHIGDASSKRDDTYFHNAIRKHGQDNFIWTIIHDDITTIDLLNQLEIFYIGYYDTFENGYNLTMGGGGSFGCIPSEETRRKMSENHADVSGKNFSGKNASHARAIIINNKHFDTRIEAAKFIGIDPSSLRYRILHKTKWQDYSYLN